LQANAQGVDLVDQPGLGGPGQAENGGHADAVAIISPPRASEQKQRLPLPPGNRRWHRRSPSPSSSDLDGLNEGPAEGGEAVLDLPWRFGMTLNQTVLLESAQRLGKDLARDAADEAASSPCLRG
jgi:hypothetical protein